MKTDEKRAASGRLISVVVPVYNEAENIHPCLRSLWAALRECPHEILICYDHEEDTTLPAVGAMTEKPPTVRLVKNDLGAGVAYALQAGFAAARGDVVAVSMADLADPPDRIPVMADRIRKEGAHVVAGSRYMKGGSQHGGPWLKRTLSRLAGLSLYWLAGLGTRDATNNFRAYSADLLRQVSVESRMGFEVALELTVKAHRLRLKIDEVPSDWRDRSAGESRFRLWRWMPAYLKWYAYALATTFLRRRTL
jgi:glycosyltransferase involved in cell wall biosynthesis